MNSEEAPLLEVRNLSIEFKQGRGKPPVRAVSDVCFAIRPGETVGLVGESGSGKSTIGRAILGLAKPSSGVIRFDGRDITHAGFAERRQLSTELQVIFQDPYSSLNPTATIGRTLRESLLLDKSVDVSQANQRVASMLTRVGLSPDAARRYPSNFSGGQRQRIAIARALMAYPRVVICDEPVSALDLSVQAQVLNLLSELQDELQLSYLFVAHDLDVVRHLSHRILVLYKGQLVEQGDAARVYASARHPYTRALLASAPIPDPAAQRARQAERARPEPAATWGGTGCPFAPRCSHVTELCRSKQPLLEETDAGTTVACHHWQQIAAATPTAHR